MTEIYFFVKRSKLIRGPTIMKGSKMGLTGGIINKVRYIPLLTDPKVSHGRHEVTVIITDKKKARECIAGLWCEHLFTVKNAERICELRAVNAGKWNNQNQGWLDVALASRQVLITAESVQLGQPMWHPLPWQQQSRQGCNASYFSRPTQFNSQWSNLWVVSGGWAQAGESWYYRNKLPWDHQLSMQISFNAVC